MKTEIGSQFFAAVAREMRQRGKTALVLWSIEGNPVRALYERPGGTLAGEKNCVDDFTGTTAAYH